MKTVKTNKFFVKLFVRPAKNTLILRARTDVKKLNRLKGHFKDLGNYEVFNSFFEKNKRSILSNVNQTYKVGLQKLGIKKLNKIVVDVKVN